MKAQDDQGQPRRARFKQDNRSVDGKVDRAGAAPTRLRARHIGECQNNDEIQLAEVAGRRAVLGIFQCSLYAGVVGGARRPRHRLPRVASAPIGSSAPDAATFDALRRIVVASDGAAAWTATRSDAGVTSVVEVRRRIHGSAGLSILLDSGTDIDHRTRCASAAER